MAVLAGALTIVLQRPEAILNAQFWAEDGAVFFAEAHNSGGLAALLSPYAGYFHLVPRAVAAIASWVPLGVAPLAMNAAAILIATLPAVVLVSGPFDEILPDARARIALAIAYLVAPNGWEVFGNVANTNWHLGVVACLLALAPPCRTRAGTAAELVALGIAGLSGPLALIVLPVSLIASWSRGRRALVGRNAVLAGCAIVQGIALMTSVRHTAREIAASPEVLTWIVAVRVFLGAFLGDAPCDLAASGAVRALGPQTMMGVGAVLATAFLAFAVPAAPATVRLLAVFGFGVLASSLLSPLDPLPILAACGNGARYWFIPGFTILALAASLWTSGRRAARATALACLSALVVGVAARRFSAPPAMADLRFGQAVQAFERAPRGALITIPINPPPWMMQLVKR